MRGGGPERWLVGTPNDTPPSGPACRPAPRPKSRKSRKFVTSTEPYLRQYRSDLFGAGDLLDRLRRRLGFQNAAFGRLALFRLGVGSLLKLAGRKQTAVGQARTAIGDVDDAANLGLQRLADFVQQIGNRRVERRFCNGGARGSNIAEVFQVRFQRIHAAFFTLDGWPWQVDANVKGDSPQQGFPGRQRDARKLAARTEAGDPRLLPGLERLGGAPGNLDRHRPCGRRGRESRR